MARSLNATNTIRIIPLENGTRLAIKMASASVGGKSVLPGVLLGEPGTILQEFVATDLIVQAPATSIRVAQGASGQIYSGRVHDNRAVITIGWKDDAGRSQNGLVLATVAPDAHWVVTAALKVTGSVRDVEFGPEGSIVALTSDENRRRSEGSAPSLTIFSQSGAVLGEFLVSKKGMLASSTLHHLGGTRYALVDLAAMTATFFDVFNNGKAWSISNESSVSFDAAAEQGVRLLMASPEADGSLVVVRVRRAKPPHSEVLLISRQGAVTQVSSAKLPWNVSWSEKGRIYGIADGPDGPLEESLPVH